MKIGIDLLWVKHKATGGMETYARNLLDGFKLYADNKFKFVLYLAKDNYESFSSYFADEKFEYVICNIESMKVGKRILWENFFLNSRAIKDEIDILFTPVYSKPLMNKAGIKQVTTFHDLQAAHFPEYFSKKKNLWLNFAWKRCAQTSDKIVAISEFIKRDIIEKLDVKDDKIKVIYNPIVVKTEDMASIEELEIKYDIEKGNFYYTVSSMLPHKNLKTILYTIKEIKLRGLELPNKLVISGIGGKSQNEIKALMKKLEIEGDIVLTGYISDEERNTLYKYAKLFLFPSIFEGFGMPPIEALKLGTPTVLCDKTCLKEVTRGEAVYIEECFSIDEWIEKIQIAVLLQREEKTFPEYELECITNQYLEMFKTV